MLGGARLLPAHNPRRRHRRRTVRKWRFPRRPSRSPRLKAELSDRSASRLSRANNPGTRTFIEWDALRASAVGTAFSEATLIKYGSANEDLMASSNSVYQQAMTPPQWKGYLERNVPIANQCFGC